MPRVNFQNVEEAQDYSVLPQGEYVVSIAAIDDRQQTRAGDEMWEIRFRVEEGEYRTRTLFDRISFGEKALPRVKLLCMAAGVDVEGEVDVTPSLLRDKRLRVYTEVEDYTDNNGNEKQRNNIPFAGFAPESEEPLAAPSLSEPDDDLPF